METVRGENTVTKTPRESPRQLNVGPVVVHTVSGRIRGPRGSRRLDPKVLAVLLRLVTAEGHVVTREELLADVWPGVVVSDTALSRCIYQARKALGEVSGDDTSPIETLPKRGYRLAWPVDRADRSARQVSQPQHPRWATLAGFTVAMAIVLAGLGIIRLPDIQLGVRPDVRIAVFPPDDLSAGRNQRPFAVGLAREIAHELARLPGMTVIGRISTLSEQPRSASLVDLAERLDADFALGGSIRAIGDDHRVLLDLRHLPDGEVLWSQSFLLEADAPFDVIRNVVYETAQRLEFSVDPDRPDGSTRNPTAFQAYLAAASAPDYAARKAQLEQAVQLDPGFARAWNRLAAIEVMPVWNGETTVETAWARAEPNVERALELVPDLPDALVTLGRFRREFGDLDGAIALFRRALEQDPGHAFAAANLGLVLRFSGRFEEALSVHRQGVAMDPLDAAAVARLGTSYWFVEKHDQAERQYRRAAELAPGNAEIYDSWAGMLAMGRGRFDLALAKIEEKMRIESRPTPRTLGTRASLADTLGLIGVASESWQRAALASTSGEYIDARQAWCMMARGETVAAGKLLTNAGFDGKPDPHAQLILGLIDLANGESGSFLRRAEAVLGEMYADGLINSRDTIDGALVLAFAYQANGRDESAQRLLKMIRDTVGVPQSREHFWLATVLAMSGDVTGALAELGRSPPGWVRSWAPLAMQDARYAALHDSKAFTALIAGHLRELERQRVAYLAEADAARISLLD
jgi:DNA-binding winged helix-turn-helix (wHTH) protein/TolB-like protein/Tfp pilus assembly protein PilF